MRSCCSTCTCRCWTGSVWPTAIRREEAKRGLPRTGLIAVTADALKGEDARCFAAGMDGFLPKPISLDALARTLGRWIPDLAAGGAASVEAAAGALFDPEALRGLFGVDARGSAGAGAEFRRSATRDIAAMRAAPDAAQLAASAHRLKGAARSGRGHACWPNRRPAPKRRPRPATSRAARRAADGMERLLAETLRAMRSVG